MFRDCLRSKSVRGNPGAFTVLDSIATVAPGREDPGVALRQGAADGAQAGRAAGPYLLAAGGSAGPAPVPVLRTQSLTSLSCTNNCDRPRPETSGV